MSTSRAESPIRSSAWRNKCSGFGIVTFSQLLLGHKLYKREALIAVLAKAFVDLDEIVEDSVAINRLDSRIIGQNDRDTPRVVAIEIDHRLDHRPYDTRFAEVLACNFDRLALDISGLEHGFNPVRT